MIRGCSRDQLLHGHKKIPSDGSDRTGRWFPIMAYGAPSGTRTRDTLIKSQERRKRVRQ